jgi:hypothetical protein
MYTKCEGDGVDLEDDDVSNVGVGEDGVEDIALCRGGVGDDDGGGHIVAGSALSERRRILSPPSPPLEKSGKIRE